MKYFAVIDTNVLVSAMLNWESNPGSVMELTFAGVIVPLINDEIIAEYRLVLTRPKFSLTEDIIEAVVSEVEKLGIFVDIDEYEIVLPDPKDVVFYKIVMEERKTKDAYLVTGNIKHFPNEPYVVTPKQMIEIISQG
jgi:putative PIN family toxin of toxin-antitoxin system